MVGTPGGQTPFVTALREHKCVTAEAHPREKRVSLATIAKSLPETPITYTKVHTDGREYKLELAHRASVDFVW